MAGLDPAIHASQRIRSALSRLGNYRVDPRVKPGDDEGGGKPYDDQLWAKSP